MIRYVDTSAALKLIVDEEESAALATFLDAAVADGDTLVSSMLLFTELHCAADRRAKLPMDAINGVLDRLTLVDVERSDLLRAGTSRWGLRSADAIHLAVALRLEADTIVTYDREQADAAHRASVEVDAPR